MTRRVTKYCSPATRTAAVAMASTLIAFIVIGSALSYLLYRNAADSQQLDASNDILNSLARFRSTVAEAFGAISVAASSLGGLGRLDDAAFYATARYLASAGYCSGHISLLQHVKHADRPAVETAIAPLWDGAGAPPIRFTQKNATGQLVIAPNRSEYAVYTNIFDLEDPSLRDFAGFDFLSIPLRAAAWNVSVARNKMVLTRPTRRLACPYCGSVYLIVNPIFTSLLPWRDRRAFMQYWRAPNPATDVLLGHIVTVFDFAAALLETASHSRFAGAMALQDITDTPYGVSMLADSAAMTKDLPSIEGHEYDPTNNTAFLAANLRKDVSDWVTLDPVSFNHPLAEFLYAYPKAASEGTRVYTTATVLSKQQVAAQLDQAAVRIAKATVIGNRVIALYATVDPHSAGGWATSTNVVVAVCAVLAVLTSGLAFFITLAVSRAREEAAARMQLELQFAVERARAADATEKERQRFMRYVFHELRVPLNSTCLGLSLVLEEAQDGTTPLPGDTKETLLLLKASTDTVMSIINDSLDLAKMEAGAMPLALGPVDVRDLVTNAVAQMWPFANGRKSMLNASIEPGVPLHILGDAPRLSQCLTNFLSNAIKFVADGQGRVELRVRLIHSGQSVPGLDEGVSSTATVGHIQGMYAAMLSYLSSNHASTTGRQEDHVPLSHGKSQASAVLLAAAFRPEVQDKLKSGGYEFMMAPPPLSPRGSDGQLNLLSMLRAAVPGRRASADSPRISVGKMANTTTASARMARAPSDSPLASFSGGALPLAPVSRTVADEPSHGTALSHGASVGHGLSVGSSIGLRSGRLALPQQAKAVMAVLEFAVTDNGCGIEQHELGLLYQPFVQVEAGTKQKGKGTGLGLAIVRQIISAHGGTVAVSSTAGQGSTFSFQLPCVVLTKATPSDTDSPRVGPVVEQPVVIGDAEVGGPGLAALRRYVGEGGLPGSAARAGGGLSTDNLAGIDGSGSGGLGMFRSASVGQSLSTTTLHGSPQAHGLPQGWEGRVQFFKHAAGESRSISPKAGGGTRTYGPPGDDRSRSGGTRMPEQDEADKRSASRGREDPTGSSAEDPQAAPPRSGLPKPGSMRAGPGAGVPPPVDLTGAAAATQTMASTAGDPAFAGLHDSTSSFSLTPTPSVAASPRVARVEEGHGVRATAGAMDRAGPVQPGLDTAAHGGLVTPPYRSPMALPPAPVTGEAPAAPARGSTTSPGAGSADGPLLPKAAEGALSRLRWLFVDDVASNRTFLLQLMKRRYRGSAVFDQCENGELATTMCTPLPGSVQSSEDVRAPLMNKHHQLCTEWPYDVVCMDGNMPVLDGYEATRQLRAAGYPGLILGVTGNALAADIANFRDAGANAVVAKPVRPDEIVTHVRQWYGPLADACMKAAVTT